MDIHPESVYGFQIGDYLVCKMMYVYSDVIDSGCFQLGHDMPQQGLAADRDQSLGHSVCQRFETGTETRSEYHSFHYMQSFW